MIWGRKQRWRDIVCHMWGRTPGRSTVKRESGAPSKSPEAWRETSMINIVSALRTTLAGGSDVESMRGSGNTW